MKTKFLMQRGCWDPATMFQYLFLLVALTAAKDLVTCELLLIFIDSNINEKDSLTGGRR